MLKKEYQLTNVRLVAPKTTKYLFIMRVCCIIEEDEPTQAGASNPEFADADPYYEYEGKPVSWTST